MGYGSSEAFELLVCRRASAALCSHPGADDRSACVEGHAPAEAENSTTARILRPRLSQVRTPFRVGEMKTVAALPTAIYQNVREDAM